MNLYRIALAVALLVGGCHAHAATPDEALANAAIEYAKSQGYVLPPPVVVPPVVTPPVVVPPVAGAKVTAIKVFAHQFTVGVAVPRGAVLAGKSLAADVPLQLDNRSSHYDGSLAWAAVSGILPASVALPATLELRLVDAAAQPAQPSIRGPPISVTFDTWQFQRSEARFGVYLDPTSIGAGVGDVHTLTLDGKPFAVTITAPLAGTTIAAMAAHGAAMAKAVNADPAWLATSKYHFVTVQRKDPLDGRAFTIEARSSNAALPVSSKLVIAAEPKSRWTATSAGATPESNWLNGPVALYTRNFGSQPGSGTITRHYPETAIGYPAIARSALMCMAKAGIPDAVAGLVKLARDPGAAAMLKAFEGDPRWAIEP